MDDRNDATARERLFDAFQPATDAEWRAAAEATLGGAPFERKLVTPTHAGVSLQPIYSAESTAGLGGTDVPPGMPPYRRGTRALPRPWDVAQELPYPTSAEVNAAAREDLPRGLTSLHVPVDAATRAGLDPDLSPRDLVGRGGVSLATVEDATALLDGIDLGATPLFVPAGAAALPVAALVATAASRRGDDPGTLHGCIGGDPLGNLARQGELPSGLDRAYDALAALTGWARARAGRLRTILVDVRPYHDGGASVAQDLAFAIATGVAYVRALRARGLPVEAITPHMQFSFSIGGTFFMEVARLRAARMLWSRVVDAFGGGATAGRMRLHARTSAWTKTRADVRTNMIRTTVEAFAAVTGGCDSLHAGTFDEASGLPDAFSRRIARNVHLVLRDESHLVRLIDPAGGAWCVEALTDAIAREAWAIFQKVERRGGMAAALAEGWPQAEVSAVREARFAEIAERRQVIVGVNLYANLDERRPEARTVDHASLHAERAAAVRRARAAVGDAPDEPLAELRSAGESEASMQRALAAANAGATLGAMSAALAGDTPARAVAIPAHRAAEQFEALRDAMDRHVARTGGRVPVFLAGLGQAGQRQARTEFSARFFRTGGFEVLWPEAFDTVATAAEAARASGAPIVVICASDTTYPTVVPPLAAGVKQGRDVTVLVAGYPAEHVEALLAAGVDEFVHRRANCLDVLARLQERTGVTP